MVVHHHIVGGSTLLMTGLKHLLSNREDIRVTQTLIAEKEIIAHVQSTPADFFWFELACWGSDVIKFCRQIIHACPKWKTVVFCNNKDPKTIREFLHAGVAAYLLPSCATDHVEEAIMNAGKQTAYIDPQLRRNLTDHILGLDKTRLSDNGLTRREKEVLMLIVQEFTTQEIANKLYISFCTVETHRVHLIQKMGVKNTAGLVREALLRQLYAHP